MYTRTRGGPKGASSGFGLWAKTLREQKGTTNSRIHHFCQNALHSCIHAIHAFVLYTVRDSF